MYQSVVGGIQLLNLPISWIVLLLGTPPYSVMIVSIIITFIALVIRLFILKYLIDFSIRQFIEIVLIPICIISIVSVVLPAIIFFVSAQNILQLLLVVGVSVVSICVSGYTIGLNKEERSKIRKMITSNFLRKL